MASTGRIYRRWELKALYGLSEKEYIALIEQNDGRCHLCNTIPWRLNIDHDHNTGWVRGVLCQTCNIALGYYDRLIENPRLLDYLQRRVAQGRVGTLARGKRKLR